MDVQPGIGDPVTQRLREAAVELGERYLSVLPVDTVAGVVAATHRAVLAEGFPAPDADALAEAVIGRARAELAIAVDATPGERDYRATPALATAWTHLLEGVAVVRAVGEFDLSTAPILRHEVQRAASSGRAAVIVDLARVSFMDLAGLAPLRAAADQAARAGSRVLLLHIPISVQRLLRASGTVSDLIDQAPAGPRSSVGGTS
ncbi:MAG: STAS domain-containing protein [Micromonosporaceae bacterium]|nr:STAS domain-containing protein [Micromonosporaceae bacterium]